MLARPKRNKNEAPDPGERSNQQICQIFSNDFLFSNFKQNQGPTSELCFGASFSSKLCHEEHPNYCRSDVLGKDVGKNKTVS